MAFESCRLVATYTDFGANGPYLGQVHAVFAAGAPGVPRLDLLSNAPVYDPRASGYLLGALAPLLPEGSLVLAVVDPGVGGPRNGLIVEFDGRVGVGPDNGLFAPLVGRSRDVSASRIVWEPPALSKSFHGRDWFAPVAVKILQGLAVESTPLAVGEMVGAEWPEHLAEVIYIDAYGNAMTGLPERCVTENAVFGVGDHRLQHAPVFGSVAKGQAFWYVNSCGLVELAVNSGRADVALGVQIGSPVRFEGD